MKWLVMVPGKRNPHRVALFPLTNVMIFFGK